MAKKTKIAKALMQREVIEKYTAVRKELKNYAVSSAGFDYDGNQ